MKRTVIQLLFAIFSFCHCACFLKKNKTTEITKVESVPSVDGQWPFLASFISIPERMFLTNRTYVPDDEHYICTGAILGYRWVLTSYQCIFPLLMMDNYTTVFTGSSKSLSGRTNAIKNYRLPVNLTPYLPIGVDITLLELDGFVPFDNISNLIKISSKTDFEENTNFTIVGYSWYRDVNDTSTFHDARHSSISYLSQGNCENKENEYLMCIGGDVDNDDGGANYQANDASLILTEIDGDFVLSGIVVRPASKNTEKEFKAVATFLPSWCDWIRYTTREEVTCN